jgi:aspartyl aminopeptidase
MPKPPFVGRDDDVVPQQTQEPPIGKGPVLKKNPNQKPAPKVGKPKGR